MSIAWRIVLFVLLAPIAFFAAGFAGYLSGMVAFSRPVGRVEPYLWGALLFSCFVPVLVSLVRPSRRVIIAGLFTLGVPALGAVLVWQFAGIAIIPMLGWYFWAVIQLRNGET